MRSELQLTNIELALIKAEMEELRADVELLKQRCSCYKLSSQEDGEKINSTVSDVLSLVNVGEENGCIKYEFGGITNKKQLPVAIQEHISEILSILDEE